ncbi:MAG: hypothetical protein K8J31_11505 [Anaerolineae bacterium]|nr:hypothetical protein [Anaerolineae bacterium]
MRETMLNALKRHIHPGPVFLALCVFLLLWRIPYYGRFVLDDPFITFRTSFNLIHHSQFTYNLGEYVLATTTPVYGLIAAIFEALNLPVTVAATILNLACEVALLYVLGLLVDELVPRWGGLAYGVAGVLIITNRAMSIASNSGMETPLFVLLNLIALVGIIRGRYTQASVAGSLATLTRPDGIFVLAVLAGTVVWRERRLPWKEAGLSLLIGLPWVIVATATYGLPIPQSVLAKSAIVRLWEPAALGSKLRVVFYEPLRFFGLAAIGPLILGVGYLGRKRWQGMPLLVFGVLHLAYVALPNNLGFDWYFAPLFTLLNVLVAVGLAWLLDGGRVRMWMARACTGLILMGVAYSSVGNYLSVAEIDSIWRAGMFRVVDYLNANADEDALIQSTNIGILGYYTHRPMLDPLGLASPEATALIDGAADLTDLLRLTAAKLNPDYIISFGTENYAGYVQAAEFPTSTVPLVVYRRAG